jgi:peptidoglycan/LPS O-acetylase OafA/YrhL
MAATDSRHSSSRLGYLDALRATLVLLVIAHHSVEPYVSQASFWTVFHAGLMPRGAVFLWVNATFFMGLMFFLAGYFTESSFARKGGRKFLADRFVRLGIPLLIGVVAIIPFQGWFSYNAYSGSPWIGYWDYFTIDFLGRGPRPALWWRERWPEFQFGHLWFVEHLLVYAVLYAAWRLVAPSRPADPERSAPPRDAAIVAYAIGLTLVTVVIRQWYPQDTWIGLFRFIQMEPAHIAQYASLFAIGCYAGPKGWIATMPTRRGLAWLAVGCALAALAYVLVGAGLVWPIGTSQWMVCAWESAICASLCVGLPVGFRELRLGAGRIWRMLDRNSYAAYVFHFPLVMAIQWALLGTGWPAVLRMVLTVPAAWVATLALTNFVILRLPGARRVF